MAFDRPIRCVLMASVPVLALAVTSCNYGPPAVKQPRINPTQAGRMAIEMYDTNGDGVISGEELEKAPALKAALPRLDTNGDGAISAEEVAARVKVWQQMGVGLTAFRFQVRMNGQPLSDATVVFEPAPFLGEEIKAAEAVTDESGFAIASVPKEARPTPTTPPGMAPGLYHVRITKSAGGQEQIPPRYNEETILAQEVASDVPEIEGNRVVYDIQK